MINLEKIFKKYELRNLPDNYKQACYKGLLSFLEDEYLSNKNLQSLHEILQIKDVKNPTYYLSTFFYSMIRQKSCKIGDLLDLEYDFLLFICAFDSLFHFLDNTHSFVLDCPLEASLLLPCTGINLAFSTKVIMISKNENSIILKFIDGNEKAYVLNKKQKIAEDLTLLDMDENNYLYKNVVKYHAHFDFILPEQLQNYFSKLNQAIIKLQAINLGFVYHLRRLEFIVPMAFVAEDITKSFTLSGIPHVVFLSDCNSIIKLIENLIHESLHDELNIFMNYYDLTGSEKKYYYSAWRDDPRPIRGLLHAIYVFTGIFDFYSQCLKKKDLFTSEEQIFIAFRYELIFYELGLAFYQLAQDASELTELGCFFINELKLIYDTNSSGYATLSCPRSIVEHVKKWEETNIAYKLYKPPQDFFIRKIDCV